MNYSHHTFILAGTVSTREWARHTTYWTRTSIIKIFHFESQCSFNSFAKIESHLIYYFSHLQAKPEKCEDGRSRYPSPEFWRWTARILRDLKKVQRRQGYWVQHLDIYLLGYRTHWSLMTDSAISRVTEMKTSREPIRRRLSETWWNWLKTKKKR